MGSYPSKGSFEKQVVWILNTPRVPCKYCKQTGSLYIADGPIRNCPKCNGRSWLPIGEPHLPTILDSKKKRASSYIAANICRILQFTLCLISQLDEVIKRMIKHFGYDGAGY